MVHNGNSLKLTINNNTPYSCHATIIIPSTFINALYHEASLHQKKTIQTYGFQHGRTPMGYIEQNYKSNLTEHIKEFLFKYCTISFLYHELIRQKLFMAGQPRLEEVIIKPNEAGYFHFEISLVPAVEALTWKDLLFKAPKRKNYKDIDRQVESFLKEELNNVRSSKKEIDTHDWVCFDIYPVNDEKNPILDTYKENLWLRIGDEEADQPFKEVFLHRTLGEVFHSDTIGFQEYFSDQLDTMYTFCIHIKDIVQNNYFDIDQFKHHFNLKTPREVNNKLIEVFSFRNDISQRRSTVEDALALLLTKNSFDVPNHLILRQQKLLLEAVQQNPDYFVYKNQPDFQNNLRQLAIKQTKEAIVIDQLCYGEQLSIQNNDIKGYLNLFKRPRTKEFIYFNPPSTKIKGQEIPLPTELLKQFCLREKTLNYVIHHLTRK